MENLLALDDERLRRFSKSLPPLAPARRAGAAVGKQAMSWLVVQVLDAVIDVAIAPFVTLVTGWVKGRFRASVTVVVNTAVGARAQS